MKKLFRVLILLVAFLPVLLAGCGGLAVTLFGEGTAEDRIEVGIHNSLESTAIAYKEARNHLRDNEYNFTDEEKADIERKAQIYRVGYHAALDAWDAYKDYGDEESRDEFIHSATATISSFTEFKALIDKKKETD